jgi:hypothetical protein
MNVVLEFSSSAFSHDVSEADIRNAFMNALYDDILDEFADKHILLGCDRNGNVVVLDDLSATYLHARADGSHKTITEIIGEMVREKIADGAEIVHAGK